MNLSPAGLELLKSFEGIIDGNPATTKLDPYVDPAPDRFYTVGWGHALTQPDGSLISVRKLGAAKAAKLANEAMMRRWGAPAITREQASELLHDDVARFAAHVSKRVGNSVTQGQFDAMVSFAFNCGMAAFDKSSLLRLHLAGKRTVGNVSLSGLYADAINKAPTDTIPRALVAWSKSGGRFMLGLFRRRLAETLIYGGHDYSVAISTAMAFRPTR